MLAGTRARGRRVVARTGTVLGRSTGATRATGALPGSAGALPGSARALSRALPAGATDEVLGATGPVVVARTLRTLRTLGTALRTTGALRATHGSSFLRSALATAFAAGAAGFTAAAAQHRENLLQQLHDGAERVASTFSARSASGGLRTTGALRGSLSALRPASTLGTTGALGATRLAAAFGAALTAERAGHGRHKLHRHSQEVTGAAGSTLLAPGTLRSAGALRTTLRALRTTRALRSTGRHRHLRSAGSTWAAGTAERVSQTRQKIVAHAAGAATATLSRELRHIVAGTPEGRGRTAHSGLRLRGSPGGTNLGGVAHRNCESVDT